MKDISSKTKLTLLLIFWALIFLIAGMGMAKSESYCGDDVYKIVVEKSEKRMMLLNNCNEIVKEYKVVTGKNKGAKQCDGDKKTPEGTYHIVEKRDSKYHRFLALDYPQTKDLKKAKEKGCYVGDSIGIHSWVKGLPLDGSLGCIRVMTKDEIMEIDKMVKVGTEVEIRP